MSKLQKRKELIEKANKSIHLIPMVDESLVNAHLESHIKEYNFIDDKVDKLLESNNNISNLSAQQILQIIETDFDDDKKQELFSSCRRSVIDSIVRPFGIAQILFSASDRDGGSVDTIHNSRNGIYANEKSRKDYENREAYDSNKYHAHKKYIDTRKKAKELHQKGELIDEYSGKKIKLNQKYDLDHTKSAKQIHEDQGRVLADMAIKEDISKLGKISEKNSLLSNISKNSKLKKENISENLKGENLANVDSNLNITDRSINRSKKEKDGLEFDEYLKSKATERRDKIEKLKNKDNLTDKQIKELNKLKKLEDVDSKTLREKDKQAKKEYNKTINKAYYTSNKFLGSAAKTSAKEGAKMGIQQVVGMVLVDFTEASFIETKDFIANDVNCINDTGILYKLKVRLDRVANNVLSKWKTYLVVFKDGFISGILSNIVTLIINTFLTTFKRFNRIIREGFFSLTRAIKTIVLPPEGIPKNEVMDSAIKTISSSVILSLGILAEEAISKAFTGIPFGDKISMVVTGLLTGLTTCFVIYCIDKADFFNVNGAEKHMFIVSKLEEYEKESYNRANYNYSLAMDIE